MRIIAPEYYCEFKCISHQCKHSCCIGWEIDVDAETMEKYNKIDGTFGQKLKVNIEINDECACFMLSDNERCPFLNKDNLCDIILEFGEEYLSQICTDHPRFRNFFDNTTEIGLGLCCEEAGRIILSQHSPFKLIIIDDDNEKNDNSDYDAFTKIRKIVLNILTDREFSIDERVNNLKDFFNFDLPQKNIYEWCEVFLNLEILDDNWKLVLNDLKHSMQNTLPQEFELWGENLLCYFVYRHLPNILFDDNIKSWLAFIVLGYEIVKALVKMNFKSFEDIVEYARLYSSEIEYSQENIDALIEELKQKP